MTNPKNTLLVKNLSFSINFEETKLSRANLLGICQSDDALGQSDGPRGIEDDRADCGRLVWFGVTGLAGNDSVWFGVTGLAGNDSVRCG